MERKMDITTVLLCLLLASATAMQRDVPGKCSDDDEGNLLPDMFSIWFYNTCIIMLLGYFLMVAGGVNNYGQLDDVELVSLDLASSGPVPDCLANLTSLPTQIAEGAGAVDNSGNTF